MRLFTTSNLQPVVPESTKHNKKFPKMTKVENIQFRVFLVLKGVKDKKEL